MTTPRFVVFVLALAALSAAAPAAHAADEPPDAVTSAPVVTLAAALRAARAHQPALDLARGSVTTARGVADQTRGALLPQLNASASYQLGTAAYVPQPGGTTPGTTTQAPSSSYTTIQLWKGALTGSQLIYGGRRCGRRELARHGGAGRLQRAGRLLHRQGRQGSGRRRARHAGQSREAPRAGQWVRGGRHAPRDRPDTGEGRSGPPPSSSSSTRRTATRSPRRCSTRRWGSNAPSNYDLSDEELPPVAGENGAVEALIDDAKQTRPEMANLGLNLKSQELGLRSAHDMYWPNLGFSGFATESGQNPPIGCSGIWPAP